MSYESLVELGPILPTQFVSSQTLQMPGAKIALAALEWGLYDFQKYRGEPGAHGRRLHGDAGAWIFETARSSDPASFANVCAALGLDPDYIRLLLERWRETQVR